MLSLLPSAARAEVCDKEVPNWNFATGPVSQLDYLVAAITSPFGVSIMAILVLAIAIRKLWLKVLGGVLTLLVTLGMMRVLSDPIFLASVREGCRAEPHWVLFSLASVLLAFLALAARDWKGNRSAHEANSPH